MKRIALFATAAFVLAACGAKDSAPAADTAAAAAAAAPAAAAPAPMDSMAHDSTTMAPPADSIKR